MLELRVDCGSPCLQAGEVREVRDVLELRQALQMSGTNVLETLKFAVLKY